MADQDSINWEEVVLEQMYVGAISSEGFFKNDRLADLNDQLNDILCMFFLKPFKPHNFFTFSHELDVEYNGAFASCRKIFESAESMLEESQNFLKLLYSVSENENIKEGEFYVAKFAGVSLKEEQVQAIGIFKSEDRDPFIRIYQEEDALGVSNDEGISLHNVNKGALIFDDPDHATYSVLVFDRSNKISPARFWIDHFLNLSPIEDEFYRTKNFMHLCKDFVLKDRQELDRADQVDLLNRSVDYFKDREQFNQQEFEEEVLLEPETRQAFIEFQENYAEENQVDILQPDFEISKPAFKAAKRYIRSVIKLDKNFHVYVHGKRELIERGYDDSRGQHFYKLFFDSES